MLNLLDQEQLRQRREFAAYADTVIAPAADEFDRDQLMPREAVRQLAEAGHLASAIPPEEGGRGVDPVTYGLLTEEVGRTCSSMRNLVAVEDMVAHAIWKWGTEEQRIRWLPRIAAGETVAAFALTEPDVGSDAKSVATTATEEADRLVLRGRKKWISFGEVADLYLVFVQYEQRHTAVLVERDAPGLEVTPIRGLLGLRGSMLAELTFHDVPVPTGNLVARPGFGLTFVASSALDLGRYSTAWGCVGLAQACLDASLDYAGERRQYGATIDRHQLVHRMLVDLAAGTEAARLLCYRAGVSRGQGNPEAVNQTLLAKYFASTMAHRAASDAVQIHGAQGIGGERPVQRFFRDAKVMEIIEGTTQIQQAFIDATRSRTPR